MVKFMVALVCVIEIPDPTLYVPVRSLKMYEAVTPSTNFALRAP